MAGQLLVRKMAITRAADQISFAKSHNYPAGWIDDRMVELRHQVKMFKQVAENSMLDHAKEFGYEPMSEINVRDLMEMGY
jgi:hypothetical protein